MNHKNLFLVIIFTILTFFTINEQVFSQQDNVSSGRETLVNVTNVAANTYRYAYSMSYFRNLSLHIQVSGGVTVTYWATNDERANTSSDNYWVDITELIFGTTDLVDDNGLYFIDTRILPLKFMIKYVTSDNTNSIVIKQIRY